MISSKFNIFHTFSIQVNRVQCVQLIFCCCFAFRSFQAKTSSAFMHFITFCWRRRWQLRLLDTKSVYNTKCNNHLSGGDMLRALFTLSCSSCLRTIIEFFLLINCDYGIMFQNICMHGKLIWFVCVSMQCTFCILASAAFSLSRPVSVALNRLFFVFC